MRRSGRYLPHSRPCPADACAPAARLGALQPAAIGSHCRASGRRDPRRHHARSGHTASAGRPRSVRWPPRSSRVRRPVAPRAFRCRARRRGDRRSPRHATTGSRTRSRSGEPPVRTPPGTRRSRDWPTGVREPHGTDQPMVRQEPHAKGGRGVQVQLLQRDAVPQLHGEASAGRVAVHVAEAVGDDQHAWRRVVHRPRTECFASASKPAARAAASSASVEASHTSRVWSPRRSRAAR